MTPPDTALRRAARDALRILQAEFPAQNPNTTEARCIQDLEIALRGSPIAEPTRANLAERLRQGSFPGWPSDLELEGAAALDALDAEAQANRCARSLFKSHFWHSFVAHPLMAVLHLFGATRAGDWVHDRLFAEPEGR